MTRRRPLNLVMTAICSVVLAGAAACSGGGTSASSTTSAAAVESQQTEESLAPPPAESTGAEQPQSQQNQPSVQLAALPVGGSKTFDSPSPMCVQVRLSQSLPNGVQFRIKEVVVTGDFMAVDGGGGCDDPCPDLIFGPDTGQQCNAKVAWVKPKESRDLEGKLGLRGACVAPDAVTCNQVLGAVDQQAQGQLVDLFAPDFEPPPSSSSSSEDSQSSAESSSATSTESSTGSSG